MYERSCLASSGRHDKIPFLDSLHSEIRQVESILAQENVLYKEIQNDRPGKSALAILCGEYEDRATMVALAMLRELNCRCVCLTSD
eukprot:7439851-Lingulodinium_polyedra.AAC.1